MKRIFHKKVLCLSGQHNNVLSDMEKRNKQKQVVFLPNKINPINPEFTKNQKSVFIQPSGERDQDWDVQNNSLDIDITIETFIIKVLISRLVSRLLKPNNQDWYWDFKKMS